MSIDTFDNFNYMKFHREVGKASAALARAKAICHNRNWTWCHTGSDHPPRSAKRNRRWKAHCRTFARWNRISDKTRYN